jgi:CheY-like chemotaxis protein
VPEPAENDDGRPIALVADPSRTVRRLLARCLDQCGFRTLSASSGVEALEQLSRWTPELVICDVALPRLNGFELCRMIGSCPSSRPIPVMLLSRSDAPAEWQRAERAGAVDLVTIPFSPAALAAKIGEHCRNASVGSSGSPVA